MRILAIIYVDRDDMEHYEGKPRAAWSFLAASSAKYIHETWIVWKHLGQISGPGYLGPLEGNPVTCVLTAANGQTKDNVDMACYLQASHPRRNPGDIDRAFDMWLDLQHTRLQTKDGSLVIDAAPKWLDGKQYTVSMFEPAEPKELCAQAFTDYIRGTMTENGYVQHSGKYNAQVAIGKLPYEYRWSFFNHYPIFKDFQDGVAKDVRADVLKVPKPALVIGSGSSLDDALPYLKDWKGAIFCSSGHASTLLYYGFSGPLFIFVFDIFTRTDELKWVENWEGRDVTLVAHPGVNPELLDYWKGRKLYYRCMDLSNVFFSEVLPKAYDFIQTGMLLFACSGAAQLSIANCMGYSPLFLVGLDFSLVRFKKWIQEAGEWVCRPDVDPVAAKPIKGENGTWTEPLQVFYKVSTETVWRIDSSQCINTSPVSLLRPEMPFADIKEVVAKQGEGFESIYLTKDQINETVDRYLARRMHFIVHFKDGGVRAVECGDENWRQAIKGYMENANNYFISQGKPEKCIDVEANLARFDKAKGAA